MFNANQPPWEAQNTAPSVTNTPEGMTNLSPISTFSEPTSPPQKLPLHCLSLSIPRARAIRPNLAISIQLVGWDLSPGIAGTELGLRLLLDRIDPKYCIVPTISLESKITRETTNIPAQISCSQLDANPAQRSAVVICTFPETQRAREKSLSFPSHPFAVRLFLDFEECSGLSRHTIHLGEFAYIEQESCFGSRKIQSLKALQAPELCAKNQTLWTSTAPENTRGSEANGDGYTARDYSRAGLSFLHETVFNKSYDGPLSFSPSSSTPALESGFPDFDNSPFPTRFWPAQPNENSRGSGSSPSDATDFLENGEGKLPLEMSHVYPTVPDCQIRSASSALTNASRPGCSGRSRSHSESGSMGPHELHHVKLHSRTRVERRLELTIEGILSDMRRGWTSEELRSGRRLVQFRRRLHGSMLTIHFQAVPARKSEPDNRTGVVSCIYRDTPDGYFITSVDMISLIESLVGMSFPTPEKNRIRRNLQGFKPLTVTKSKTDCEAFFKRIMSFQNPKPRKIEKDIKVFPWISVDAALAKVLGKYTCISDGPDDPNVLINFDFHSSNRESMKLGPEFHGPFFSSSNQGSPLSPYEASMLPSSRPARSHSTSAQDFPEASLSNVEWLKGSKLEESPEKFLSCPQGKPREIISSLPWLLAAQFDSPSSSSSFETNIALPYCIENDALSTALRQGGPMQVQSDNSSHMFHLDHQRSDVMLQN